MFTKTWFGKVYSKSLWRIWNVLKHCYTVQLLPKLFVLIITIFHQWTHKSKTKCRNKTYCIELELQMMSFIYATHNTFLCYADPGVFFASICSSRHPNGSLTKKFLLNLNFVILGSLSLSGSYFSSECSVIYTSIFFRRLFLVVVNKCPRLNLLLVSPGFTALPDTLIFIL